MTKYLEPCPMCGDFVPYTTNLDDGEDVRWAEWSCRCGLQYYAESRIVNERGVHDADAELAELFGAWNTRAVRTCRFLSGYPGAGQPGIFCPQDGHFYCSVCERSVHLDPCTGKFPPYCPHCGAKAEEVDE